MEKILSKLNEVFEEIEDKIVILQNNAKQEAIELGGGNYKFTDEYYVYCAKIEYFQEKLNKIDEMMDDLQRGV